MSSRRSLAAVVLLSIAGSSCDQSPGRTTGGEDEQPVSMPMTGGTEPDGEPEYGIRLAFDRHRRARDHSAASAAARQLVRIYTNQSRFKDALRWGDLAYAEAVASGEDSLIGAALLAALRTLQFVDDSAASDEMIEAAERFIAPTDLRARSELLIYRGLRLGAEGYVAEAVQMQREASSLARRAGDLHLQGTASVNLASLALERHRLSDAAGHLREARELAARQEVPPTEGILINEAILARENGQLEASRQLFDQVAADASDDAASILDCERGRTEEAAGRLDQAEELYRAAMANVEAMRSASAPVTSMAEFFEKRWEPFERLFSLQLNRGDVRGALDTLTRAQGRMFLDALARASAPSASAALGRARDVMDQVGELQALQASPLAEVGSLEFVLAAQRDRHVIVYFGGERLRSIVIENGEPRIASTDVPKDQLDRMVSDLRSEPDDPWLAARLGEALLPPDALPAPGERIYVVPTGPLLRVPFSALMVSGQRVVDRFEVAYAPSLTALAAVQGQPTGPVGRAVVMADRRLSVKASDPEVQAVVDAAGAEAYLDRNATTDRLRGAARADLLHVITHSAANAREGFLSLDDDGEVTASDIVAWQVRPRLAVLPTCASAATPRTEMWGSLAAGFLAAGSEHVVATLVAVRDEDAARFALAFYRHGGARDPVGGLARAQRELATTDPVARWSPYIVIGP